MTNFNKDEFIEEKKKEFDRRFKVLSFLPQEEFDEIVTVEDTKKFLEQSLNEAITKAVEPLKMKRREDDAYPLYNDLVDELNEKIDELTK